MLWQQHDQFSSNHTPCHTPCPPQAHQAAAVSSPHTGPMPPMSSSNNVLQSSQLGAFQISPTPSSTFSCGSRGQLQQLLSPPAQTGGLPSLPKLTPLPSQPPAPMLGSHQAPPSVSAPQSHQDPAGPTGSKQVKQFGGCASAQPTVTDNLTPKTVPLSVTAPQHSSMESTLNAQGSINLLSILNSLSPSQLESLLNSTTKDSQLSPMSVGNGRHGNRHSSIGESLLAVPHSQTTVSNFPHQNCGSSIPPNLSIPPHHSTPAANYREPSLVTHNAKPKVVQVNKTAASATLPQFMVRSSCTGTELRGQVLQLEPTAAVMQGYDSNATTAGSVSALRLQSHQIN